MAKNFKSISLSFLSLFRMFFVGLDELVVDLHQPLEVFHCFDSQLQCGVFVTDEDGLRVLLEGRDRPHVADALLHRFVESKGLVGTGDDNHDLFGRQR